MGKRTSYAKLMELAAQKRGKFEQQLQDAERRGDRFGINSATRSIAKLEEYEREIFDSQEQQKADKGIAPPQQMYATGGPIFDPFSTDAQITDYLQSLQNPNVDLNDPAVMQNIMGNLDTYNKYFGPTSNKTTPPAPQLPAQQNLVPSDLSIDWNSAMTPNTEVYPVQPVQALTPRAWQGPATTAPLPTSVDTKAQLNKYFPNGRPEGGALPEVELEDAMALNEEKYKRQDTRQQLFDQAKTFAPYAAQFAGDLYALNQLKNLERPVEAPYRRATLLNTDLDTSATRARLQDNMRTFNAGVDTGVSNSAAAQNLKLANLAQTNRQLADIGQQEANQESMMRNRQAAALTDTFNANQDIGAANRQRMVDFNNMITNARLGIVQGMGTKAAQVGSEYAQRALDQKQMDLISRRYGDNILSNNFSDLGVGANILEDPALLQQQINLLNDPEMGQRQREFLARTNPTLLARLDEIMGTQTSN
jgi:hypothetical protein